MTSNDNSEAILLLAAQFSSRRKGEPTPLTPVEYGKLSVWLRDNELQPVDLLLRFDEVKERWEAPAPKVTLERLEYLLGRGMAMGMALEKWDSAGIWSLTRADAGYPSRLKKILGQQSPPVLFGVGEKRLLEKGGLAVVGSRDVSSDDERYARQVSVAASDAGMSLVSGGARGVDETAMLAALDAHGTAVGVLANGLLAAAVSGKWKPHLRRNDLCLISPYSPEASFHVGTAMGRNKYIYCLADFGLVVRSEQDSGGTWAGATEALKKSLAPVFVKPDSDADGNRALIELGAAPLPLPAGDRAGSEWLAAALEQGANDLTAASEGESKEREGLGAARQPGLFD